MTAPPTLSNALAYCSDRAENGAPESRLDQLTAAFAKLRMDGDYEAASRQTDVSVSDLRKLWNARQPETADEFNPLAHEQTR